MLVPLSWIKKYVDIPVSVDELVAKLNASGTSVEHVYSLGQGLDDLVVGHVEEVYPHPQADRLRLAKVNDGQKTVEVVCGASNLAAGQKIVFARPGSRIPVDMHDPQRKPFTLSTATIRGVVSNGMICSTAEMGLGQDHDGILVLDQNLQPGTAINQALDYPQTILDLEITTNRSDELSVIGIAREVATLLGQKLNSPQPTIGQEAANQNLVYEPAIQDPACYRLITRALQVKVGPSPYWLQQALELSGMRPINNVVDITNYVMLEFGQPLHAYDTAKLQGQSILARLAMEGESITTLDGQVRTLTPDMLIIADEQQPIGIAGIMGGQASAIEDTTQTIVLEAAVFDPVVIRKTANTLALRSEASKRFERSVDREQSATAIDRAIELLTQYAQAKVAGPKRQLYPQPYETKQLNLSSNKLFQYLGRSIDPLQARDILASLGFSVNSTIGKDNDWQIALRVPSWRMHDIQGQEDLIEEVARILGYDELPKQLPSGPMTGLPISPHYRNAQAIKQQLAQRGWTETMSISLVGQDLYAKAARQLPSVSLSNPLSSEWTHIRDSLVPSLIQVVANNYSRHHQPTLNLFELSHVYEATSDLPSQKTHLALAIHDQISAEHSLATLKATVISILNQLGVPAINFAANTQPQAPYHDDYLWIKSNDRLIGNLGYLDAQTCQNFDIPAHVLIAELDIDQLINSTHHQLFIPLDKYPSLEEDLSLLIDEQQPIGPIIDAIIKAGQPLLQQAYLTDTYRHDSLGKNQKSPLIHLVFRHPDKTLSSQEVAETRTKIVDQLKQQGITLRV